MCGIETAVSIGLGALSAVNSLSQQSAQARETTRQRDRNIALKRAEAIANYGQIQHETASERRQAADENAGLAREARRKRAQALVASGERGVAGASVVAQQRDIAATAARAQQHNQGALDRYETEQALAKSAQQRQTQAFFDRQPKPRRPNYFSAGLQVAHHSFNALKL
jgi:hypothetical protein